MKDKENQIKIKRGELVDLLNQEQEELQKAKSIEEMAQTICEFAHSTGKCDCVNSFAPNCTWKDMATSVYNAGYRKITDSVVLSREEICELKCQAEEDFSKVYDLGSKETAEKILKDFKLWAREYQNKDTVVDENGERLMTNNEKLNYLYTYLCDKYKVKIKE